MPGCVTLSLSLTFNFNSLKTNLFLLAKFKGLFINYFRVTSLARTPISDWVKEMMKDTHRDFVTLNALSIYTIVLYTILGKTCVTIKGE